MAELKPRIKTTRDDGGKGRVKGVPNVKKTETGYQNYYGVEFTAQEKKALESAVNSAMRKRKRMLEPPKGQKPNYGFVFGVESDFILAKKSKSLQQFRTKRDYEVYMDNLARVNQRDYVQKRIQLYQENHAMAMMKELHDADTAALIGSMDMQDYINMVQEHEDTLEIHYVYDDQLREHKVAAIRSAIQLYMKEHPAVAKKYANSQNQAFRELLAEEYKINGDARLTLRQRATAKKGKRKRK